MIFQFRWIVGLATVAVLPLSPALAAVTTSGSVWQNTYSDGRVFYRVGQSNHGTVTIDDGTQLTHDGVLMGGWNSRTFVGTANVDGPGTVWTSTQTRQMGIIGAGHGVLNITNGGVVRDEGASWIAANPYGSRATITIDGPGSTYATNWVNFGSQGSATMDITNGGTFTSVGSFTMGVAATWSAPASSAVTVTGAGSRFSSTGYQFVMGERYSGSGAHTLTLNVRDQALAEIDSDLVMARNAIATAVVNLDGGTLQLYGHDVVFGPGAASFNFIDGTLAGVGTFGSDLHQQGGRLAAGASPGAMTIDGDYQLDEGAVLEIELGAADGTAGLDHDVYHITGQATLSGSLDVLPTTGFEITEGVTYDVMTATTIDTALLTLHHPSLFDFEVVAHDNGEALRLTVLPEPSTAIVLAAGILGLIRPNRRVG